MEFGGDVNRGESRSEDRHRVSGLACASSAVAGALSKGTGIGLKEGLCPNGACAGIGSASSSVSISGSCDMFALP
jgi:hypothetical protein